MKLTTLATSVLLTTAAAVTGMTVPPVARLETELGVSDGTIYPDNTQFGHTFLYLGHTSSAINYLPSVAPFRGLHAPSLSLAQKAKSPSVTMKKRYVHGFSAPSGYDYSWVKDGYRLALATNGDPNYLTRTTIEKTGSTTQRDVNACAAFCDKTPSCAMASVIRFANFSEGNVICAVYSATAPQSDAKYTTGLFNGAGEVKASYTFNRKAGKVPGTFNPKPTTTTSGFTTVRTSPTPSAVA